MLIVIRSRNKRSRRRPRVAPARGSCTPVDLSTSPWLVASARYAKMMAMALHTNHERRLTFRRWTQAQVRKDRNLQSSTTWRLESPSTAVAIRGLRMWCIFALGPYWHSELSLFASALLEGVQRDGFKIVMLRHQAWRRGEYNYNIQPLKSSLMRRDAMLPGYIYLYRKSTFKIPDSSAKRNEGSLPQQWKRRTRSLIVHLFLHPWIAYLLSRPPYQKTGLSACQGSIK